MAKKKASIFQDFTNALDNTTITGTGADDTIVNTGSNVTVNAGAGVDIVTTTLNGRSDDLLICQNGQAGNDILNAIVNSSSRYLGSVLNGGGDNDTITTNTTLGNAFTDTLLESYAQGGAGTDTIDMTAALNGGGNLWQEAYGDAGGDTITMVASTTGGAGTVAYNYAEGGANADTITATISGPAGVFVFNEIYGDSSDGSGSGADNLTGIVTAGTFGASYLYGGAGSDTLRATGGSENELYGGGGNDTFHGSTGVDYFSGGAGFDTFFLGSGGNDVLVDYVPLVDTLAFEPGHRWFVERDRRRQRAAGNPVGRFHHCHAGQPRRWFADPGGDRSGSHRHRRFGRGRSAGLMM